MKDATSRLHYVDWLRVVATIGIFLSHNARPYNDGDWHVKNAQLSLGATQFVEFMNMWMMPLFSKGSMRVQSPVITGGDSCRDRSAP